MTRDRLFTALELVSAAAIVYGAALVYGPAGWILAGVAGLALSFLLQLADADKATRRDAAAPVSSDRETAVTECWE